MELTDFPALMNILNGLEGTTQQADGYLDEIKTLTTYGVYLVNLLDERDVAYRGESFKYGVPMCLLVVKVSIQDEPYVCFVNALSRTNCYRIFLRRWLEDSVEWRPDKFG